MFLFEIPWHFKKRFGGDRKELGRIGRSIGIEEGFFAISRVAFIDESLVFPFKNFPPGNVGSPIAKGGKAAAPQ